MASCICLFREATSSGIDEGENLETLIFTSLSRDILSGDFVVAILYVITATELTNQKYQSKTELKDKCFNSTDESRIDAALISVFWPMRRGGGVSSLALHSDPN
jgi:hypothetical protein